MASISSIAKYYDLNAEAEDSRLSEDSVEYLMTYSTITKYLLSKSTVLDMGGGTGVYAVPLAVTGYRVTLVDISAVELALAEKKSKECGQLINLRKGDAFSYTDEKKYDGVLCLGPLYHCASEDEILHIIKAMLSCLSTDGYLFCSFISIFAKFNRIINELNNCSKSPNLSEFNSYWPKRISTKGAFCFEEHHSTPISLVNPLLLRSFLDLNGFQVEDLYALDIIKNYPKAQFSNDHYRIFHQLGESALITQGEHIMVVIKKVENEEY